MRICKNLCELYRGYPRNYNDGRKCCRLCEIFIKTSDIYCPCCSSPLAYKGRANQTQLARRAEKKMEECSIKLNQKIDHNNLNNMHIESVSLVSAQNFLSKSNDLRVAAYD